jgi:hypothetical protein
MGAKQSAEMSRALELVDSGMSAYAAANKLGLYPTSVRRARKRRAERMAAKKGKKAVGK